MPISSAQWRDHSTTEHGAATQPYRCKKQALETLIAIDAFPRPPIVNSPSVEPHHNCAAVAHAEFPTLQNPGVYPAPARMHFLADPGGIPIGKRAGDGPARPRERRHLWSAVVLPISLLVALHAAGSHRGSLHRQLRNSTGGAAESRHAPLETPSRARERRHAGISPIMIRTGIPPLLIDAAAWSGILS